MSYAPLGQLAGYLYDDEGATGQLPADASRLLKRASELVQDSTVTAFYRTDTEGNPSDERTISAFQNATCAQVEFWVTGDEEDDVQGPLQGMSAGSQQPQSGAGQNRATPRYLAPRAARFLRLGGLLDASVYSV